MNIKRHDELFNRNDSLDNKMELDLSKGEVTDSEEVDPDLNRSNLITLLEPETPPKKNKVMPFVIGGAVAVLGIGGAIWFSSPKTNITDDEPAIVDETKDDSKNESKSDDNKPFVDSEADNPKQKSAMETLIENDVPILLENVEFVSEKGDSGEPVYRFTVSLSEEAYNFGWRIGDFWGVPGAQPVTMDNATLIQTWWEDAKNCTVTQLPNKRWQFVWETELYVMGDSSPKKDSWVVVGVNPVKMDGDKYEEGDIAPVMAIFKYGNSTEESVLLCYIDGKLYMMSKGDYSDSLDMKDRLIEISEVSELEIGGEEELLNKMDALITMFKTFITMD